MAGELVLDAGFLIAFEKGNTLARAVAKEALEVRRVRPIVPAPVVAQYWRDGSGRQALGARLLKGCEIIPLDYDRAIRVGKLLGLSGTKDAVDATVAVVAHESGADVVTTDPGDIRVLLDALQSKSTIIEIT